MWSKYKHVIPHIAVESGVINTVAPWVVAEGYRTVLVACDPNTRRVAGERVIVALKDAGLTVLECCFPADEPLPDEFSIGFLTAIFTPDVDLILAVGSGTINDICTFVGARVDRPSAIVGTAPSMDGFAAIGSAMLLDGIKVTPPTQCPVAIFCDVDILKEAPMLMIAAGLGDMLGKINALADWRLSHILTGEAMPEDIVNIIETALDKVIKGAPYITRRDPAVIQSITEGLILSGIAMSLYGDSRPASCTEHHLSHFWEMSLINQNRKPALHGVKVGIGTIVALVLWKGLLDLPCPSGAVTDVEASEEHINNLKRLYGRTAEAIMVVQNPCLPIEHIQSNWQDILGIARSLPEPEEVAAMLLATEAPINPSNININGDTLTDSIIYARDRKKTFSILQLLGNLGRLEDFAGAVNQYFATTALTGVKCFVLDMDGTIYLGNRIFPFTLDFLDYLKKSGMDYIFFTNNSSQNAVHYLSKLERMGIKVSTDRLLMSTHVLLEHLKTFQCQENRPKPLIESKYCHSERSEESLYHVNLSLKDSSVVTLHQNDTFSEALNRRPDTPDANRVFVAGTEALRTDFYNAGYVLTEDNPDFVVLGFDTDMDYERLTKLCDFVRSGLPYYGVHIDYNCPVESGFIPDCGSLAAAVAASTGITPEFFGKPSRYALDYIIEITGYRENELCFIGDRLYTDIAITAGTKARSVLVLSGETKLDDLHGSKFMPDLVVDDLADLMTKI